jgi:hypothetical protein
MVYIRSKTLDGEEIADFMLAIFRDENRRLRDRMEAATWLADRAFGRPALAPEMVTNDARGPIRLVWGNESDHPSV